MMMSYFTYIARCNDDSFYVGYCRNIKNREYTHNSCYGASYTKQRIPIKIVYYEEFMTRIEAVRREKQIKKWTRLKKENLIIYGDPRGK